MIKVQRVGEGDPLDFEVVVREGKGETRHRVTMSEVKSKQLTAGKHTPERCLEAAFRFLLDRRGGRRGNQENRTGGEGRAQVQGLRSHHRGSGDRGHAAGAVADEEAALRA